MTEVKKRKQKMYRKEDIKHFFLEDDCLYTKSERLDKNNFGTSKHLKQG